MTLILCGFHVLTMNWIGFSINCAGIRYFYLYSFDCKQIWKSSSDYELAKFIIGFLFRSEIDLTIGWFSIVQETQIHKLSNKLSNLGLYSEQKSCINWKVGSFFVSSKKSLNRSYLIVNDNKLLVVCNHYLSLCWYEK